MVQKNNVYEIVRNRICEKIQKAIDDGTYLPWQQPWSGKSHRCPRSYVSGCNYNGINRLLLEPFNSYLTWNQILDYQKKDKSIKLRKGSKAEIVVYFNFKKGVKDIVAEDGSIEQKEVNYPYLRFYQVFNSKDVENLPPLEDEEQQTYEHDPIKEAEQVLADYIARENISLVWNDGEAAYYSPAKDLISLPRKELFSSYEKFFATAMHECAHSTGAENRLNRLKKSHFGDETYSREELVSEITQNLIFSELALDNSEVADNSIAYLKGWLEKIRNGDVRTITIAAAQAQKAANFILGRKIEQGEILQ